MVFVMIPWIIGILIAGGLGYVIFRCVNIVPQSECWITEFLGQYKSSWNSGLHLKIPFFERVVSKVSMKERTLDFPPQGVITRDNVEMGIDSVVFLQVMDAKLFTYGIDDPILAVKNLTSTTLRNIVGTMEFDATLTSREQINDTMTRNLDEATDPWGIRIKRVEIKSIMPPDDIKDSMTKQMKAERERRQTVLEAEAHKTAVVTRAEGDKQAKILAAEADRDASIARAEGRARSIQLVYQAEAEGLDALNKTGVKDDVLRLKGLEGLKDIANGNSTKIFMPTDITKLISVGGAVGEALGIGDAIEAGKKMTRVVTGKDTCCDESDKSGVTREMANNAYGQINYPVK